MLITKHSTANQVAGWLVDNKFNYMLRKSLKNYGGAALLGLTPNDLKRLGIDENAPDSIRLFATLRVLRQSNGITFLEDRVKKLEENQLLEPQVERMIEVKTAACKCKTGTAAEKIAVITGIFAALGGTAVAIYTTGQLSKILGVGLAVVGAAAALVAGWRLLNIKVR